MTELGLSDFPGFFRAIHGHEPFLWQCRLLSDVVADGWPDQADMPTASGKTAVIDIAVYALALDAASASRCMPLRTVFMVDRRLVVDDAHGRAMRIASRLAEVMAPPGGLSDDEQVLWAVAARLATLASPGRPGRTPLQVSVLRGGLPRDNGWVSSVSQPTIVVSTVDQVGSRLLFRGYGVSQGMAPVHAGLLGEDTLMLLDEAHLSAPFMQTLEAVSTLRRRASEPVGLPCAVMTLSATPNPRPQPGRVFRLDMDRAGPDRVGSPLLDRRFTAVKQARLIRAPANGGLDKQARIFVNQAKACARQSAAQIIGVVVNRVKLARKIHDLLAVEFREVGEDPASGGSLLLTGRCRPFARDILLGLDHKHDAAKPYGRIIDRIRTGRDRGGQTLHKPLFIVGTQAIEAGADLDFDALVTEMAPWPSLRQRFGRLDRAGKLGATTAWIVCTFNLPAADPAAQDPVYEAAGWNTRRWLWTLCGGQPDDVAAPDGVIDLGVDGQLALGEPPAGTALTQKFAPRLTPAVMDLFAQTSPRPYPDPDPALWLHGPKSAPADVQIVWRADAPRSASTSEKEEYGGQWATYAQVLAVMPPTSAEALPLPVWSAKAFLSGLVSDAVDLEMADAAPAAAKTPKTASQVGARQVFVWGGAEASGFVRVDQIKPGSTIILPSRLGGCDRFGWVPAPGAELVPTQDISEAAILRARDRVVVRLHPGVLEAELWARVQGVLRGLGEDASDAEAAQALLGAFPGLVHDVRADPISVRYAGSEGALEDGIAFISRPRHRRSTNAINVRTDLLDDDDFATLARGHVPLPEHCDGVSRDVDVICAAVGLRRPLRTDLLRAARYHDYGKAEARFKALMWNEDLMAAIGRPPLAKSLVPAGATERWSGTFARVGLPRGARHECWSVALLEGSPLLEAAEDPDLVLWLVGTHHGHGRPFFQPVDDPSPVIKEVTLDVIDDAGQPVRLVAPVQHGLANMAAGWVDRFDSLIARYGYWGIAYLEAVVRLSDARRSRVEEETIQAGAQARDLFDARREA